jgi:GNAT superfamily N-acetyltransferase
MTTMIEIHPYELEMLAGMAAAYNDAIRFTPHCYPATTEELAHVLKGAIFGSPSWSGMREEAAFVALDGSRTLGFIHVGLGFPRNQTTDEYGVIRFFCYERGRRDAGQALLDAGEAYLQEFGVRKIGTADHHHKYPFFQIESSYLSERVDNVHALMGMNGYRADKGEVILEWPNFTPPDPGPLPLDCEIQVVTEIGRASLPKLKVQALIEGREIGVCAVESVGEYVRDPLAQDWALTAWLGIEPEYQAKRLGKHLLARGLEESRNAVYRHALISTDWRNYRAFTFYSNFGYTLTDWTYRLLKNLSAESEGGDDAA